jgi:hypothetical protein
MPRDRKESLACMVVVCRLLQLPPPPPLAVGWMLTSGDCSGVHYGVENEVGCLADH